jgi:hypothetical protein
MRPRHSLGQFAIGLLLVGLVTACIPASGFPSGAPSAASPAESAAASEASDITAALGDCQPLDLALPSGEPLDLTGSWEGNDVGPYQLRQFGDCLWMVGQNATFTLVYVGQLHSDFTIHGRWATVAASDHLIGGVRNDAELYIGSGSLTLGIVIGGAGANEDVWLEQIEETDNADFGPGYSLDVTTWTRVDSDPDHPIPAATPT